MHAAKDLLGLSEAFAVNISDDVIGELTEQEALEACFEMGIAVTPGEATLPEMHAALRAHMSDMKQDPAAVFAELDVDHSGSLSYEEALTPSNMHCLSLSILLFVFLDFCACAFAWAFARVRTSMLHIIPWSRYAGRRQC